MEFLIVTGLSGAGKTQAAHFLEDLGYYCVDNMPSALLQPFAEFCIASQGRFTKVALVTDVRAHESFEQLFRALDSLRALDCTFRILFLEAPESTLVRRYKETRRRHPLAEPGKTVQAALREEIALMQPVRDRADYIINTQNLTLAQLHKKLCRLFTETGEAKLPINVVAFGYKYGIPIDADLVLDVRFLPNPYYIEELKDLSGLDQPVYDFVMQQPDTAEYMRLLTAFIASAINAVMGVILAWVLVRYRFPCKRLLNGMIELPFALPTAVAGIALTSLTADTGLVGKFFARFGIEIAYTRAGITVALVFIGIPFVVRTVQPILEKLDPTYEEAAGVMGASRIRIFWKVIFPEILPATLTGFGLAFGRCLGEYGSVVFIAGNQPYETEITPLIIMSKLQEYDYTSATSIALVMLVAAFLILFFTNLVQARSAKILKGGQ